MHKPQNGMRHAGASLRIEGRPHVGFQTAGSTRDQSVGGKLTGQKLEDGNSNSKATEKRPSSDPSARNTLPVITSPVLNLLRSTRCPARISTPTSSRPP